MIQKINKWIPIATFLVVIAIGLALVGDNNQLALGGRTNYDELSTTDGYEVDETQVIDGTGNWVGDGTVTIGASGDVITEVTAGTCYIFPYATTVVASSTALVDCQASPTASGAGGANALVALTGVSANDHCMFNLSTTTAGTGTSLLSVLGASASTTSGVITARVYADSGTVTWPVNAASGTAHYICTDK